MNLCEQIQQLRVVFAGKRRRIENILHPAEKLVKMSDDFFGFSVQLRDQMVDFQLLFRVPLIFLPQFLRSETALFFQFPDLFLFRRQLRIVLFVFRLLRVCALLRFDIGFWLTCRALLFCSELCPICRALLRTLLRLFLKTGYAFFFPRADSLFALFRAFS